MNPKISLIVTLILSLVLFLGLVFPSQGELAALSNPEMDAQPLPRELYPILHQLQSDTLPTTQSDTLTASDAEADDQLGFAVAVYETIAVIGAPFEDSQGVNAGAAYVFERALDAPDQWHQVTMLTPTNPGLNPGDAFGVAVAVSDDTVFISAHTGDGSDADSGIVYVFSRNQGGSDQWGQIKILTGTHSTDGDRFGTSVAVNGDPVIVGAPYNDYQGSDAGLAYVFARNQGGADNWGQIAVLTTTRTEKGDLFGQDVALSRDTAIVGAPLNDIEGTNTGAAYIFERNAGGMLESWGLTKLLTLTQATDEDRFGYAVALDADRAIASAPLDDTARTNAGAVYVFERNTGGADAWGLIKTLTDTEANDNDQLGYAVTMYHDVIIAGAPRNDVAGTDAGATHVFERNVGGPNAWGQSVRLIAESTTSGDREGNAVSIYGETILTGAPFHNSQAIADSGAAYVFTRYSNTWSENAQVTGQDKEDALSFAVALSGDFAVVGAPYVDASPTLTNTGVAYVLERNQGGTDQWGQVKTLTATNATTGDEFGYAVAIEGDTIVVGARFGDSGATDAGAAYIFQRNVDGADQWKQIKMLADVSPLTGEQFGCAVALSGNTVIVGASEDGSSQTGAAYVFTRNQGGVDQWGQVKKLIASNPTSASQFGTAIALDNDVAVIGAPQALNQSQTSGAAYIYARNQDGADQWGQVTRLTSDDGADNDGFGHSVAIQGNHIIVGAPGHDLACEPAGASSGAVYVFTRNQDGADAWGSSAKLTATDAQAGDVFGTSVTMENNLINVGAPGADTTQANTGATYVFEASVTGWQQKEKITREKSPSASPQAGDSFGYALSASGNHLIVGAPYANGAHIDGGTVYVYRRSAQADVAINKTLHPTLPIPGQYLTYTLTFTNVGFDLASGVYITDIVPGHLTNVNYWADGNTTVTPTGNISYTWHVNTLSPGATGTLTLTGLFSPSVTSAGTTVTNTATIATHVAETNLNDNRATAIFTLTNFAPLAVNDTITTSEEHPVLIPILNNDVDINQDPITLTAVTTTTHGIVTSYTSFLVYTPTLDFSGSDILTYTIQDSQGLTDTATVYIHITPINDAPTLSTLSNLSITEDAPPQTIALNGITSGAANEAQTLTVTATLTPTEVLTPAVIYTSPAVSGSLHLTPAPDAYGSVTVTITVSDGLSETHNDVQVFIAPRNDPPTLDPLENLVIAEDAGPQTVPLQGIYAGPPNESQPLTVIVTFTNPALLASPTLTYVSPASTGRLGFISWPNTYGRASITVTVSDGLSQTQRSFSVTVTPVNDPPIISPLLDQNINENTSTGPIPFTVTDVDAEQAPNEPIVLTVTAHAADASLVPPSNIRLRNSGTGSHSISYTLTLTPAQNLVGTTQITVSASDTLNTTHATFTLTVHDLTYVYLPLLLKNHYPAPDLIVESIQIIDNGSTENKTLQLSIKNQGDAPVLITNAFWVDVYINPDPIPTHVNQSWNELSNEGAVWGVERPAIPLAPGASFVLTVGDEYYKGAGYSNLPITLPVGTQIYAQVDSFKAGNENGAVLEKHELMGLPYNNITGFEVPITVELTPTLSTQTQIVSPALPARTPKK